MKLKVFVASLALAGCILTISHPTLAAELRKEASAT
jgi:hypothetical protein